MKQQKTFFAKNRSIVIGLAALILGLGILAIYFVLTSQNGPSAPGSETKGQETLPAQISVEEAAQKQSEGAYLLDVREVSEWEEMHIQGAELVPLGQLATRLDQIPTDREIVVVCRSGKRSAEGRDILLEAGFSQVTSMTGGMNAWKASGLPTEASK